MMEHMEERHAAGPSGESRDSGRAVQILATEHWGLLAARSIGWNETFARAGLYLTVLSASVVALALVAQATEFDDRFALFALVLLPVVFFIGVATTVRVAQSGAEDLRWVTGMNLIRHAYLEMEPSLAPYLVASAHDDERGYLVTVGAAPGARMQPWYLLVTVPGMLVVVNSVVGGVIIGVVAYAFGGTTGATVAVGCVSFLAVLGVQFLVGARFVTNRRSSYTPRFPTPNGIERR